MVGGVDVELFQKCANISSWALISKHVLAACSVCLWGGTASSPAVSEVD